MTLGGAGVHERSVRECMDGCAAWGIKFALQKREGYFSRMKCINIGAMGERVKERDIERKSMRKRVQDRLSEIARKRDI